MTDRRLVFTNGCFDILHRGHLELLKFCSEFGEVVVGLNSDSSVRRLKGAARPINTVWDRKTLLEACRFVDRVEVFEEDTPLELIRKIKPDLIVKGGDYSSSDVIGKDLADVKIFRFVEGYSTTKLIERILRGNVLPEETE